MYEQATYFVPKIQSSWTAPTTKGSGIMKRNHEIKIRFNEKEFEQLTEKVRKSKLSREKFVRQCVLKNQLENHLIWITINC